jgi:hypothetical protein
MTDGRRDFGGEVLRVAFEDGRIPVGGTGEPAGGGQSGNVLDQSGAQLATVLTGFSLDIGWERKRGGLPLDSALRNT